MSGIDLMWLLIFAISAWASYSLVRMMHLFGGSAGGPGGVKGIAA